MTAAAARYLVLDGARRVLADRWTCGPFRRERSLALDVLAEAAERELAELAAERPEGSA